MTVKVILKQSAPNGMKEFAFGEQAILDNREAGRVVLACGVVSGGWVGQDAYSFKDGSHIAYDWNDIERLEITP